MASPIVSGIIRGRETNTEEFRRMTVDQDLYPIAFDDFPSSGVGLSLTCDFGIPAFTNLRLPLLRLGHWYLHQEARQGAHFSFYLSDRFQFSL